MHFFEYFEILRCGDPFASGDEFLHGSEDFVVVWLDTEIDLEIIQAYAGDGVFASVAKVVFFVLSSVDWSTFI